ncbi:MAG TPA: hypothetical protein VK435_05825, partial [Thermodesulfovibrionales bacterium]|nr:hypothetical protein [Thermodesulfovibrionales bacterium]
AYASDFRIDKRSIVSSLTGYLCFAVLAFCCGCAAIDSKKAADESALTDAKSMQEKWGIKVKSLRLSASGNLLDLRYQVTNTEKASALFSEKDVKPCLIDQATGAVLSIPDMAKIGALRSSPKNLLAGKTYFMMFANPGLVKQGSKTTVVIGDFKAENLTVE